MYSCYLIFTSVAPLTKQPIVTCTSLPGSIGLLVSIVNVLPELHCSSFFISLTSPNLSTKVAVHSIASIVLSELFSKITK
jgi:hypothetical protein